jgi:hypothetical protein
LEYSRIGNSSIAVFSAFTSIFFSLGAPLLYLFYTLARRRDQLGEKDTYKMRSSKRLRLERDREDGWRRRREY